MLEISNKAWQDILKNVTIGENGEFPSHISPSIRELFENSDQKRLNDIVNGNKNNNNNNNGNNYSDDDEKKGGDQDHDHSYRYSICSIHDWSSFCM